MPATRHDAIQRLIANIEGVVFGKHEVVKLCVVGLLARGHILIEDVPGTGKTTIAQTLARSIDCSFHRIQFTSDMLPADILGVSILDQKTNEFEFRKGPIFASVVLADEINRTPPKTQSALMEAMSEYHITSDGVEYALPEPFIVLATQNPIEYEGTYVLPESQLDRFLLRTEMGYPPREDELRIMRRRDPHHVIENIKPALTANELLELQGLVGGIHVDESVSSYMLSIVEGTRTHPHVQLGASPRGSLAFYEACQALALVEGRDYVTPHDVKTMAIPVLSHRVIVKARGADLSTAAKERDAIVNEIVKSVPLPV
ncbi:MAG: AAA domain-containing protein [Candidatus Hydrogenedens sp.]|nr:AAA domain-containing protein [Candidatus Hydrogenedens sp.]